MSDKASGLSAVLQTEMTILEAKWHKVWKQMRRRLEGAPSSSWRTYQFTDADLARLESYRLSYPRHILGKAETVEHVVRMGCSVSRIGDGELLIACNKRGNAENQYVPELASRLREIAGLGTTRQCLVCINIIPRQGEASFRWFAYYYLYMLPAPEAASVLNPQAIYGDAFAFRPQRSFYSSPSKIIGTIRNIWQDRKVLFVTGEGSSFEFSDELFGNVAETAFVYGRPINTYLEYDKIFNECLAYDTTWVVYIALGAAGSVLAFDLSKRGYQALDFGNLTFSLMHEACDIIDW